MVLWAQNREMDRGPRSSEVRLALSDPVCEAHNREMGLGIPLSSSQSQLALSDSEFEAHNRDMDLGIQTFSLSLAFSRLVSRDHNHGIDLGMLAASSLVSMVHMAWGPR